VYRPEVEALTRSVLTWDNPAWNLRQALDHFDEVRAARVRHGELHSYALETAPANREALNAFCADAFGTGGAAHANDLVEGHPNRSLDTAVALWGLSRLAASLPAVAELLRAKTSGEALRSLRGVAGGPEFMAAFDVFLAEYGYRNEAFTELVYPRWLEEPSFPLLMVRRYMDLPDQQDPAVMHEAQARRRRELTAELAGQLAESKRSEFLELVRRAGQGPVLLENHNFYIDQKGLSSVRVPVLALGRRLVAQGAVDAEADVFYLHLADIERAAVDSSINLRPVVAANRAERERWLRVTPPATIGAPPVGGVDMLESFFGALKDAICLKRIVTEGWGAAS
jgi:pyruvate,water dikinase